MAIRKVYRSDSVPFFNIEVDGQRKRVRFTRLTGGDSYYESTNAKEQEQLEKHPWYGLKYILWNSTDAEETEKLPVQAEPAEKPAEASTVTPTQEGDVNLEDKEFGSAAEAKAWLISELGAKVAEVRNIAAIRAFGASKGLNIIIG